MLNSEQYYHSPFWYWWGGRMFSSVHFASMIGLLTWCRVSRHIVKLYIECVHFHNWFIAAYMFNKLLSLSLSFVIVIVIVICHNCNIFSYLFRSTFAYLLPYLLTLLQYYIVHISCYPSPQLSQFSNIVTLSSNTNWIPWRKLEWFSLTLNNSQNNNCIDNSDNSDNSDMAKCY